MEPISTIWGIAGLILIIISIWYANTIRTGTRKVGTANLPLYYIGAIAAIGLGGYLAYWGGIWGMAYEGWAPLAITPPGDELPPTFVCGNGVCEAGETAVTCPADCTGVTGVCGNGICEATETAVTCPGDCKKPAAPKQQPISTFKVIAEEKWSGSMSLVGNASMGYLEFYKAGDDPADPDVDPIVRVNVTEGTATKTAPGLKTDKDYRLIFNGGDHIRKTHAGGWYSIDFGIIQLSFENYQLNTGEYLFEFNNVARMATLVDPMQDTANNDTINGQSTGSTGEVIFDLNTNNTLTYDESGGDGTWYAIFKFGAEGGDVEIQGLGYKWDNDDTNPCELDELSAITVSHDSGTNFGLDPNQLDEWIGESWIDLTLGTGFLRGGNDGKHKFAFSVKEDNLEPTDIFYMRVDDLKDWQGKDVILNKGLDYETVTFHNTA